MAGYSAIGDVGDTLVELLRDEITEREDGPDITRNEVALASPSDVETDDGLRLTLYLYRVSENAHLKNAERQEVDTDRFRDPPLALDLYYLLTAHPTGDADVTTNTSDQHKALGLAMQILRDNSILRDADLQGSLADGEELNISIHPQQMDEMGNIWSTFHETPFQPSVSYIVTPVLIESREEKEVQRVVEREVRYAMGSDGAEGT